MEKYKIDLLSHNLEGATFEYDIDDEFFASIGGLINRGSIRSTVKCVSAGLSIKFMIHSEGSVVVPCDRCLSDLELRIETTDELNVKLGDDYSDDGVCVVVPEAEGYIDLAQYIYEFIALSMPMTCCHAPGKCDETMMQELSKHQSTRSGDEDEEDKDSQAVIETEGNAGDDSVNLADSRWAALRELKNKL